MVITVSCPSCSSSFPVDSNKIPLGGVNGRCSSCGEVFRIERPEEQAPPPPAEPVVEAAPEPMAAPEPEPEPEPEAEPEPEPEPTFETPVFEASEVEPASDYARDPSAETDFSIGAEPPAAAEDDEWVVETEPEIDAGSLNIEPMETVESSVEQARAEETLDPTPEQDLADPMALAAEPGDSFFAPAEPEPEPEAEPGPEAEAPAAAEAPSVAGFSFGKRDPKDKARRLARVLVSDMISYNPDRHERALANGSLKADFEDEIEKSWKEYVEQVGEEMANDNPFWVEALNDVLAKGEQIF